MSRILLAALPALATLAVALLFLASPVLACGGEVLGASWYGPGFHGRPTANGERFDQEAMTAAHRSLPFGTRLRVTHGGRSVVVRINDRGPYVRGRALDLSKAAARRLGLIRPGHARVCVEHL